MINSETGHTYFIMRSYGSAWRVIDLSNGSLYGKSVVYEGVSIPAKLLLGDNLDIWDMVIEDGSCK